MTESPLETEVKFYVRDLARIEQRLLDLGASLIQPRILEINLRFDLPDRSLSAGQRALRLRQDSEARLTYKGPPQHADKVSTRIELEFTVGDFETARQTLGALGYVEIASYEKYRATYQLDDFHIMLDELPYGDFIEIEGTSTDSIHTMADRLELDWNAAVENSYLALFEHFRAARGIQSTALTFAALGKNRPGPDELNVHPAD